MIVQKDIFNLPFNQKIKIISNFSEFEKLRFPWNSLLEQSEIDSVFMRHEWFSAWWQAFGYNKELFIILVLNEHNEILGIAPLMKEQTNFRGFPVRCIKFIENDDSPACGIITKHGYKKITNAILSFVINCPKWSIVYLKNLQNNGETIESIIETILGTKKKYIIRPGLEAPYIKINTDWDNYLKGLSQRSRKTLRNNNNKMKRLGNIQIREYKGIDKFKDILSITKNGWKYKAGKAFINRNDRKNFFNLLSKIAQKLNWLSLWCLYKDAEPIAYEYHLKYKDNETALLSEFDSEYKNYSPGSFLDYEVIRSLFNNNIKEYDTCGTLDEYKKKWTSNYRNYKDILIFNNSIFSTTLYLIEKNIRIFIKHLYSKPSLTD